MREILRNYKEFEAQNYSCWLYLIVNCERMYTPVDITSLGGQVIGYSTRYKFKDNTRVKVLIMRNNDLTIITDGESNLAVRSRSDKLETVFRER